MLKNLTEHVLGEKADVLFGAKSDKLGQQMPRYFIVSLAALAVDFGTLFILTEFAGLFYLISATFGFLLGVLVNYWLSTRWVFTSHNLTNRLYEFLTFSFIGVIGLLINVSGLWLLTDVLGLYYLLSKVFVTGLTFLFNFFARRNALFNRRTAIGD